MRLASCCPRQQTTASALHLEDGIYFRGLRGDVISDQISVQNVSEIRKQRYIEAFFVRYCADKLNRVAARQLHND